MTIKLKLILLLLSNTIVQTHQQEANDNNDIDSDDDDDNENDDDDDDDDDECAFISGQRCDQNGVCKYCAMCLQNSCILSKTIGINTSASSSSCNSTQFGVRNLYNWYDYCLSSDNDSNGSYCATSTECYQYRKSAGPSVTYAWHNLTCNPGTCMLITSNGAPPPVPVPPQVNGNNSSNVDINNRTVNSDGDTSNANTSYRYHANKLHNPAAIALIIVCILIFLVAICWILRLCKKKDWRPLTESRLLVPGKRKQRQYQQPLQNERAHTSISSIPSSAPPSFSSTPPDMAIIRHPHVHLYAYQPSIQSARSSTASSSHNETLPSYLSPYSSPPKYEQAIVTQIRDLREEASNSSPATDQYHRENTAPVPSMWVPVYFTQHQQYPFGRGRNNNSLQTTELFGFTPNHSMLRQFSFSRNLPQSVDSEDVRNPFDDDQQIDSQSNATRP